MFSFNRSPVTNLVIMIFGNVTSSYGQNKDQLKGVQWNLPNRDGSVILDFVPQSHTDQFSRYIPWPRIWNKWSWFKRCGRWNCSFRLRLEKFDQDLFGALHPKWLRDSKGPCNKCLFDRCSDNGKGELSQLISYRLHQEKECSLTYPCCKQFLIFINYLIFHLIL